MGEGVFLYGCRDYVAPTNNASGNTTDQQPERQWTHQQERAARQRRGDGYVEEVLCEEAVQKEPGGQATQSFTLVIELPEAVSVAF